MTTLYYNMKTSIFKTLYSNLIWDQSGYESPNCSVNYSTWIGRCFLGGEWEYMLHMLDQTYILDKIKRFLGLVLVKFCV